MEKVQKDLTSYNGRAVCVRHEVGKVIFYSTYCHLAEVLVEEGETVELETHLGEIGGSAYVDNYYGRHVHVCVFTGGATIDPSGYCDPSHNKRFEDVSEAFQGEAGGYYYGSEEEKFPRSWDRRFYDPYGVVTSNAEVIRLYQ